jgi:hypothetical protein
MTAFLISYLFITILVLFWMRFIKKIKLYFEGYIVVLIFCFSITLFFFLIFYGIYFLFDMFSKI